MRTRRQKSDQHKQSSSGKDNTMKAPPDAEYKHYLESLNGNGKLVDISKEAVEKLLKRANKHSLRGEKKHENHLGSGVLPVTLDAEGCSRDAIGNASPRENNDEGRSCQYTASESWEEVDDADWEDGSIPILDSTYNDPVTIEFSEISGNVERKPFRRATAEDKEVAELVHKVHLLCLIARGKLIDKACDDPLIQAALLSLLPKHLLDVSKIAKLTATALHPLVIWFQNNFHVKCPNAKRSFHSALAFALEAREGTSEEIAALSVALFRALNLTTRFVSILDVSSLKPGVPKPEYCSQDADGGIFGASTPMVAKQKDVAVSPVSSFLSTNRDNAPKTSVMTDACRNKDCYSINNTIQAGDSNTSEACLTQETNNSLDVFEIHQKVQGTKRKGDIEFEMQLQMALCASEAGKAENMGPNTKESNNNSSDISSNPKRVKRILNEESLSSEGISTAVGSRKVGSPLFWAEVYCSGENMTGKWVHVDAINAIVDGEQKVEALAAACKTTMRYVVAFAGDGAKDVTRRYCMKWYKIASQRVNPIWWDMILAPLRELEARETGGMVYLESDPIDTPSFKHESSKASASDNSNMDGFSDSAKLLGKSGLELSKDKSPKADVESSLRNSAVGTRDSLEDMELETRALTEPLPTNQQAYKSHALYAIEKWLTKYQVLHPKGPVLGFRSGHAVYPRTCVQTLKTKERWLREGLQLKANELPMKELKRPGKLHKVKNFEDDDCIEDESKGTIKLYGKWQLEPLRLPHAVDGIVPKNERGQVEVWSEKCLPPGTVHLKLPRVFSVAKRLEIDYAPAMVGFEFKNGQSYPIFDGIVVCAEFKDIIQEAYAEEQERRDAEEKKRNEMQAISRWYQLLSSVVTRQRLNNRYRDGGSSQTPTNNETMDRELNTPLRSNQDDRSRGNKEKKLVENKLDAASAAQIEEHEHVFLTENQSLDEDSFILTKRCYCGFSIEVEEL